MFGMDVMRRVQEMQANMVKLQEELGNRTITASSGGGMVTVVCNGRQELQSVAIDKAIVDPEDTGMLEDLVLTAVNESLRQSRELMAEEMRAITGGLNIPGLTG